MLFDSHGHINLEDFDADRDQVIDRIAEAEMRVMMPGTDFASSRFAVELAEKHGFLLAAIGLHPGSVSDEDFDARDYQDLINTGFVSAVGECGLDYYRLPADPDERQRTKDLQVATFVEHIRLAQGNNLPLIVHGRNGKDEPTAYQDILKLLLEHKVNRAVIHCFGGTLEEAKQFVKNGYYLGITGIITFDKTGVLESLVRELPLESLLIETDSPFLSPEPYRGKRNEPVYVIEVAKKMAEILGSTTEAVAEKTGENAMGFFGKKS
jgi:TatD DNase family protein